MNSIDYTTDMTSTDAEYFSKEYEKYDNMLDQSPDDILEQFSLHGWVVARKDQLPIGMIKFMPAGTLYYNEKGDQIIIPAGIKLGKRVQKKITKILWDHKMKEILERGGLVVDEAYQDKGIWRRLQTKLLQHSENKLVYSVTRKEPVKKFYNNLWHPAHDRHSIRKDVLEMIDFAWFVEEDDIIIVNPTLAEIIEKWNEIPFHKELRFSILRRNFEQKVEGLLNKVKKK